MKNKKIFSLGFKIGIILCMLGFVLIHCSKQTEQTKQTKKEQSVLSVKKPKKEKLIIFHAGSLSVPFKKIAESFEKVHPNIDVVLESAGSRSCARKISDLKKPCDVFASADYTVINDLLIPEHANWVIKFVSNEMVLVYQPKSKYADEINADNWYDILLKNDVAYGRADPDSDPCGYRTVLSLKLAEKFYKKEGLHDQLIGKEKAIVRPKEVDLLALLEVGEIDYFFLYKSVAEQHGLKYVALPDDVNLKKEELRPEYQKVSIELTGKTPGSFLTKKGEPMIYGVTIPKSAPNRAVAIQFVEFLLEKEQGLQIMNDNGQPSVVPSSTKTYQAIPSALKKFATDTTIE